MAIPTASSASGSGSLTITLPGCVNLKTGDTSATEWDGTGGIVMYAGTDVPTGWLRCNGAAVSRTDYADLFKAIGTTYGVGNGNTTFNLPDLRGRFPLALDNMGGTSANRVTATAADSLGGSGGAETHTLVESEIAAHGHALLVGQGTSAGSDPGENVSSGVPYKDYVSQRAFDSGHSYGQYQKGHGRNHVYNEGLPFILPNETGGGAHNNLPPYFALNFVIKT